MRDTPTILLNGKLIPEAEATVPVADKATGMAMDCGDTTRTLSSHSACR